MPGGGGFDGYSGDGVDREGHGTHCGQYLPEPSQLQQFA